MSGIDSGLRQQMRDIFLVVADGGGHRVVSQRVLIPSELMSESLADELALKLNEAVQELLQPRDEPVYIKPVYLILKLWCQQTGRPIHPMSLMGGQYAGSAAGNQVEFEVSGVQYRGDIKDEIRGFNVPVTVTINGDQATFSQ